ncbi:hypothetical protein [Methanoculleus sp.]|uniref:hypothetical protein n=1 Tax=Methanoculleus sp. TaxID=90427 RepID=UPI002FC92187
MIEEKAPGMGRGRIVGAAVGIGLLGGAAFLGVVEALSRCWIGLFGYTRSLAGIGITHEFVSILLVVFFAGFFAAYANGTAARRTQILSAVLAGAVAGITARTLLFVGDTGYLIHSLIATRGQVLLLVGGAMLVAGLGGLVGSFLDPERPYRDLLPVAVVTVAFITAPPLLAMAGIVVGVIPPTPYSGGPPAPETDILVLKVSATGDIEWEMRADIGAYDQPGALVECRDGYALAVTEYGREGNTVHILTCDERGNAWDRIAFEIGFARVSALVPADGGGFLATTGMPGIVRVDAGGEVVWERSFVAESQGMAPVSLLAQDGRYVAAWEDKVACFDDNGTRLWQTSIEAAGGINYHPVYQAPGGGALVFVEGQNASAGGHVETYPQAVRLDENGTVLWTRDFGSGGFNELLGAREAAPGRFAVLYRSMTFSEYFWSGVERVSHGYLATLDDDGEVTDCHTLEESSGVVVPSQNGYLSATAADKGVTLVGRDAADSEVWRQEQPLDLHSLRSIGTADGGYLVAGSVAA